MSVVSSTQFGPLYHGTDAELSPGDIIQPQVERWSGKPVAFSSRHFSMAEMYARDVHAQEGQQTMFGHVYEVEPVADDLTDREKGLETVSPSGFRVTRHVSAHPITDRGMR